MSQFLQKLLVVFGLAALCSSLGAADRYFNEWDQKMVIKTMQAYDEALRKADVGSLEKLLADDFVRVHANAVVVNKTQEISDCRSGELKIESLSRAETKFRFYIGGGIVTGTLRTQRTYKNEDISGHYRFVQMFEPKPAATWQLAFAQLTRIPDRK